MKVKINYSKLFFIVAVVAVSFLAGCAEMQTNNTTSLLSSAGFQARTPQTPKQHQLYASLPNNTVEHATLKGKSFFVYKDANAGVAYVGGEQAHQRYKQLCAQQHAAQLPEEEMNHPFAVQWNRWGPRGPSD